MQDPAVSGRIRDMRNLGPRTEAMLAEAGIVSEADLREVGAVEAYLRLKFIFGGHASLLALYAMEAALIGCDWRALPQETKDRLQRAVEAGPAETA